MGDGKMELQIQNLNVAPGQTLEGTATLTLNRDVKGKEVVAILYAEETETSINAQGKQTKSNMNIYSKSQSLDTEKLYTKASSPYQYKFSFVIPQMGMGASGSSAKAAEALGTLAGVLGGMSGKIGNSRFSFGGMGLVRWYVKVELKHESMLSFPIVKTQEINIVAQQQSPGGQI